MHRECAGQTCSCFRDDREIWLDFEGGDIASGAGPIAMGERDRQIGFTDSIVACLQAGRHRSYVVGDLGQFIIEVV